MTTVSSGQLLQQYFGLLQVFRIKSLGEPAVDFRQYLPSLSWPALLLPQPRQTRCGTQLPGFSLLLLGDFNGLVETRFRLGGGGQGAGIGFFFCLLPFASWTRFTAGL